MKDISELKLGMEVKDAVSGFTGTAVQVTENMSGMRQIGIQPKSENGASVPEAHFFDYQLVDILGDGVSGLVTPQPPVAIDLGREVADKATGFKGIAVEKVVRLTDTLVGVSAKSKAGAVGETVFFASYRVKEVGKGIRDEMVAERKRLNVSKPAAAKKAPPAGPTRSASALTGVRAGRRIG